jgi:hypothetical protein
MLLSVDYIYRLLITLDSSTAFQLTIIFSSDLLLFFLHTIFSSHMDVKALRFGYQISKQNFSVLWKQEDVYVDFNLEKRKWFFFLSHLSEAYKLEISFDSIWQIKLHRPRGQSTMFLLLQVNQYVAYFLITFIFSVYMLACTSQMMFNTILSFFS